MEMSVSCWWQLARVWLLVFSLVGTSGQGTHETSHLDSDHLDGMRALPQHGGRRRLIVSTVLEAPYMMLKSNQGLWAGNERFEGYLADILSRLSITLGFEYELRLVKDGMVGNLNPLGLWDGMIGEVVRREADMTAGPLAVTADRAEVLDFTRPFISLRSTALIRKPSAEERRAGHSRIRRVQALMESNMTFGVLRDSLTEKLFQTSTDPLYTTMWSMMENFGPATHAFSTQDGVERARHDNYAYILDTPKAEYIVNRKPCDFYTIEPFLDLRNYAFGMRRGDDMVEEISYEMAEMEKSQELQFMFLKWWEGECSKKQRMQKNARDREETTTVTTKASPWKQETSTTVRVPSSASSINLVSVINSAFVLLCALNFS